jgi:hypothetical protein
MVNSLSTADGPKKQALQVPISVYIGESHILYEADFKAANMNKWYLS